MRHLQKSAVMTVRIPGISTTFDLELSCPGMTAASLATELLLQATALSEFSVGRSGDDSCSEVRFMVMRTTSRVVYGAEFCLDGDRLLVAYFTSPADWPSAKRATACAEAFEPLFSLVHLKSNAHASVAPR